MALKLDALILATGSGPGPGNPALLPFRGQSLLQRVAALCELSNVAERIVVVTGAQDPEAVQSQALELGLEIAHDPGSLQAALRAVRPEAEGVVIFRVEQPMILPTSVQGLCSSFEEERKNDPRLSLARPTVNGEAGYPCLVVRERFEELSKVAPRGEGLAAFFAAHADRVHEHEVADLGVAIGIDAAADFGVEGDASWTADHPGLPRPRDIEN